MRAIKTFLVIFTLAWLVQWAQICYAAANKTVSTSVISNYATAEVIKNGVYNTTGLVKFTVIQDSATAPAWDSDTMTLIPSLSTKGYSNLYSWAYVVSSTGDSIMTGDSLVCTNQTSFGKDAWITLSGVDADTVQTTALTDYCELTGYSATGAASTKPFGDYFRLMYVNRGLVGAMTQSKDTATVTIRFGVRMW